MSSIGGILCNVAIKKLYINFLRWPKPLVILGRASLFFIPFVFFYSKINENIENMKKLALQTDLNIQKLAKTGNI